jgi:hypothetical protein
MHWNLEQILWALVLAAHLVLLIVLLGRDRTYRFPWFTAAIALSAVRLIADHLLHGKLTTVVFYWQTYVGMALDAILGIMVLVELARHVFSSGKAGLLLNRRGWIGWSLVIVIAAGLVLWVWGRPWPSMTSMRAQPQEFPLLLTIIFALKAMLFTTLMTAGVGLLLRIFGRRFGFGWKTHEQQIALGLSTNAMAIVAVQAIEDMIRHNIHYATRTEGQQLVQHLGRVFTNLENARVSLWFVVLVWWIVWLWRDEPDSTAEAAQVETPVLTGPPPFDVEKLPDREEGSNA